MDIRETIKVSLGLKKLPEGENFEGFSDEQLSEALTEVQKAFSKAKEEKNLPIATEAKEAAVAIKGEIDNRVAEAQRVETELAQMESEVQQTVVSEEQDDGSTDGDDTGEGDEPTPEPTPEPEPEPAQPEAIAADAEETPAPAPEPTPISKPKPVVPKPSAPPAPRSPVRLTAAADASESVSAGMPISLTDVAEAFKRKAEATRGGKIGDRGYIARAEVSYPDELKLDASSPLQVNQEKIDAVVASAQEASRNNLRKIASSRDPFEIMELAAAGGICAPPTPRYEICQQGDDDRPLRDSLVRFGATRGGILTMSPPRLSDVDGSVGVFTADQDTTGYDYPKPCIRVECGTPTTTQVKAIPLCMEYGNFMNLAYPELVRSWWSYGQVWHARTAEVELWDGMVALSDARTANDTGVGAARNTLTEIERYVAQFKYEYRVNNTPLRMWYPEWMNAILRADLTNQMPGDNTLSVSDATLAQYFAARNVALTAVLDGQDPNNGDDPLPATATVILALEGTFLFLDMGRLDFGTEIRDFTQIRNNDVGAFMETFENVAAVCNGPQAITLPLCASGKAAASDADITCAS